MNNFQKDEGFTLIEVLIALAVLAIALTAIIRSTSQNIKDTSYLQTKTIAHWVAKEVINEARVGVLKLPAESDPVEKETNLLERNWPWQANLSSTPNPRIKKINVDVFNPTNHDKLIHLESYIYAPS